MLSLATGYAQNDSIPKYSSYGIFDELTDRFGRSHKWQDIMVHNENSTSCLVSNVGKFKLIFYPGSEMEQPLNSSHSEKRTVIETLFSTMNDIWASNLSDEKVVIRFLPASSQSNIPSHLPLVATSFYITPKFTSSFSEITDGVIGQFLLSGRNPYSELGDMNTSRAILLNNLSFSHLDFYINLDDYTVNTDLQSNSIPPNSIDLYSVALREFFVSLGLNSFLTDSGEGAFSNHLQYGRMDEQLAIAGQTLIKYDSNSLQYSFNPSVNLNSLFISNSMNCDSILDCSASPYLVNSNLKLSVSHCFEQGQDMSYLMEGCDSLASVLDRSWLFGEIRRKPSVHDIQMLSSIGHSISGCFGDSTLSNNFCSIEAAINNVIPVRFYGLSEDGSYLYSLSGSDSSIDLQNVFENFSSLEEIEVIDYIGQDNTFILNGSLIQFTISNPGYQILRFRLKYQNSFHISAYLLVRLKGGSVCNFDCNFISNPSFEEVAENEECGNVLPASNGTSNPIELRCWSSFGLTMTPDLYSESCINTMWDFLSNATQFDNGNIPTNSDPNNDKIVHLYSRLVPTNSQFGPPVAAYAEEAIQSQLSQPLQAGTTYEISLRVFRRVPGGIPRLRLFLRSGEYGGDAAVLSNPDNFYGLVQIGTTTAIQNNDWQTIIFQFVCPSSNSPFDHLVIHNQADGPIPIDFTDRNRFLFIDDVQLRQIQPVTFNIPNTFICGGTIGSLQNFATPAGGIVSGPGVFGNTSFTFVSQLAGVGTHTLTYTFTSPDGCEHVATDQITVHPTVSFNTAVINPTCGGSCSGSISVAPTASAPANVVYTWQGPSINSNNINSLFLNNLCAGTYTLTATINGACTQTQSYTISTVAPPTANATVSNNICGGACSNTISVVSNSPNNTISWTGGLSGFNPTNVCPGLYTATITSPQGCSMSFSTTVNSMTGINITVSNTQTLNVSDLVINSITIASGGFLTINSNPGTSATIGSMIQVQSGGRLRIQNTQLRFLPEAMIRIQPGGRAHIQGGMLTAHCPATFWHGIEVWGTPDATHQEVMLSMNNFNTPDTDGNLGQGGLRLNGEVAIENAKIGVRLFSGDFVPFSTATNSGGYITADGAIFRNNNRDLAGSTFEEYPNLSKLRRVVFTLNSNSLDQNTSIRPRVQLYRSRGIWFEGCTWSNTNLAFLNANASQIASLTGIQLSQSSCTLNQHVVFNTITRNTFEGFTYGIRSSGTAPEPIIIDNTDFRCYRGIYAFGWVSTSAIRSCNFNNLNTAPSIALEIPAAFLNTTSAPWVNGSANSNGATINTGPAYGLYLDASSNTVIQFNNFIIESLSESNQRVGCYINNCGSSSVRIQDNKFRGLTYGIRFFNVNRDPGAPQLNGTIFSCNDFANSNRRHVEIRSATNNLNAGINRNIFYNLSTSYSNIFHANQNTVFPSFRYIFSQNVGLHNFLRRNNELNGLTTEILIGTDPNISVPNANPDCGVPIPLGNRSEMRGSVLIKQQELEAFEDDGQPQYYKEQIESIDVNNLISRYNELMDISPALSPENIIEVLEKEQDIPRSMLLSLLTSNASSLKNGDVLDRLNVLNSPLSIWERDSINAVLNTMDARDLKLLELHQALMSYRSKFIEDYIAIRMDSTLVNRDSLLQALKQESDSLDPRPNALSDALFGFEWDEIHDLVTEWKTLVKENTHEYKDLNYLSLLIDEAKSKGISLDSSHTGYDGFAGNFLMPEYPLTYRVAASIISMVDTLGYHGDLDYDYDQAETRHLINPTSEHDSKIHLSLFPNPASDFVQITAADVDLSTSTLRCLDMLGKSCPITLVSKSQHDMVIDTRSLPNGNYILELEALQLKVSTPLIISR